MAKKEPTWITSKEAAAILEKKGNRPINDRYIRRLAARGVIDSKKITDRLNLYSKEDIEAHVLSERVGRQARKEKAVA
jgi:hypothetical protein